MRERNFQTLKSPSPPCPPSSASNTAVPRRQCFSTQGRGTAGWPGGCSVRALRRGGRVERGSSLFPPPTLTSKGTCEAGRGRGTEPQTPPMQSSSAGGHSQPMYPVGLLSGAWVTGTPEQSREGSSRSDRGSFRSYSSLGSAAALAVSARRRWCQRDQPASAVP